MSHCLVYMTASSLDEARAIGRALVEQRLVACVNIVPGMTSIYRWQGAIEEGSEVVVIGKTRRALVEKVAAAVRAVHSYTVPCVVALPIEAGNGGFLAWIDQETAAP